MWEIDWYQNEWPWPLFRGRIKVTWLGIGHFQLVSFGTKSLSPAVFEILGSKQISHDLDLSWSRDVIGHVTIWLGMGHFLSVVLWTQVSISNGFRDISRQHYVLIDTMLNRHCACAISLDVYPYVKFKYIFQFLTPTLPIHYATFMGLRWRIRGVLSLDL